jgi:hypothetical protein
MTTDVTSCIVKHKRFMPYPVFLFFPSASQLQYFLARSHVGSVYAGSVASNTDHSTTSSGGVNVLAPQISAAQMKEKEQRLIQWNVKQFSQLLKEVAARRGKGSIQRVDDDGSNSTTGTSTTSCLLPFEEVKEVIDLSSASNVLSQSCSQLVAEDIDLDAAVTAQLEEYISLIARMYEKNSFHK